MGNINVISDKPNHITPNNIVKQQVNKNKEDVDQEEEAKALEKLNSTLKRITLLPKEKYTRPTTSNHDIGWNSNPLVPKNRFTYRPRTSCAVTDYASDYLKMCGLNPFKL